MVFIIAMENKLEKLVYLCSLGSTALLFYELCFLILCGDKVHLRETLS